MNTLILVSLFVLPGRFEWPATSAPPPRAQFTAAAIEQPAAKTQGRIPGKFEFPAPTPQQRHMARQAPRSTYSTEYLIALSRRNDVNQQQSNNQSSGRRRGRRG